MHISLEALMESARNTMAHRDMTRSGNQDRAMAVAVVIARAVWPAKEDLAQLVELAESIYSDLERHSTQEREALADAEATA